MCSLLSAQPVDYYLATVKINESRETAGIGSAMNRRQFIHSSAGIVACSLMCRESFGQSSSPTDHQTSSDKTVVGEVSIKLDSPSHQIPLNYNGLSYELAQLTDPNFFAATNRELIALFRLLSPQGVLRLGGNSSESCWLKVDDSTTPPELPQPDGPASEHWMPDQLFMITPEAVDHLADFMNATGWHLIYGLNFGHSSPERLAREAEYIASKVRSSMLYFQIGNEPDFYSNAGNRTRPKNWGFNDYLKEWLAAAEAIRERVPDANFGGPDVGSNSNWISQFIPAVSEKLGSHLVAISGHYYAEGPPDDPKVTTERLLRTNPAIFKRTKTIVDLCNKNNLVYRMTEGNSCYRGGKPGMSDALASALWSGDYMLTLASAGCAGVNLHGGSRSMLRASLGNHMPGESVAKAGSDNKGGYYTPIAGELEQGFKARPIFYGMLLANQFAGADFKETSLVANEIDATAYAGKKGDQLRVAIFNKDPDRDLKLTVKTPSGTRQAKVWRLTGPSLDATSGVTLAGAEVSANFTWTPANVETPAVADGQLQLELPHDSAALVFLDS